MQHSTIPKAFFPSLADSIQIGTYTHKFDSTLNTIACFCYENKFEFVMAEKYPQSSVLSPVSPHLFPPQKRLR